MERNKIGRRLITPEMIYGGDLYKNEVFIYGSNVEGRSRSGSAKTAVDHYGAVYGKGYGHIGQSYGIATIDLRKGLKSVSLANIKHQLEELIEYARINQDLTFWMTKIGTNLAGYSVEEIQNVFFQLEFPYNIALPIEFCNRYEIERKFICKEVPEEFKSSSEVYFIQQYYLNDIRVRSTKYITYHQFYHETVKTQVAPGVFQEIETEITEQEMDNFMKLNPTHVIEKTRYTTEFRGFNISYDVYDDIKLIIMEIELISLGEYKLAKQKLDKINPSVNTNIIYEVTGIKEFSNRSLAKEIIYETK